jgi:hypothetical protein
MYCDVMPLGPFPGLGGQLGMPGMCPGHFPNEAGGSIVSVLCLIIDHMPSNCCNGIKS